MDNRENDDPGKRPERPTAYTVASASGASHEKGHTLLPMLIGGLILIVLGMLAVVLFT